MLCIRYFLLNRKKFFGRPNARTHVYRYLKTNTLYILLNVMLKTIHFSRNCLIPKSKLSFDLNAMSERDYGLFVLTLNP